MSSPRLRGVRLELDDLALLAHELRTPLAVIAGHAQLLSARDEPELRRTSVPAIVEAARRLEALLTDLEEQLERGRSAEAASEADAARDRRRRLAGRGR